MRGSGAVGGAIGGAVVGVGATYVGDIIENVNQKDYVGVPVPHSSWKTYVENGVQGAFIGGFCGAFFESGVGCVGGATFGTSLAKQELNNGPIAPWQLDYCQAAVESGFAAGGTATGKAFSPIRYAAGIRSGITQHSGWESMLNDHMPKVLLTSLSR